MANWKPSPLLADMGMATVATMIIPVNSTQTKQRVVVAAVNITIRIMNAAAVMAVMMITNVAVLVMGTVVMAAAATGKMVKAVNKDGMHIATGKANAVADTITIKTWSNASAKCAQ